MANIVDHKESTPSLKDLKVYLYGKVCFRTENYLDNTVLSAKEKFDVVLCLSTVKYIHLNFGDLGVKTLFLKAYDQLEVGGIFILENQLWKSYRKKKNESERSKANYSLIELRPHCFKTYLEKIGFEHMETLMPLQADHKQGFDRPIMVFTKK